MATTPHSSWSLSVLRAGERQWTVISASVGRRSEWTRDLSMTLGDALIKRLRHAGTSPWRLASRAEAQRVRSSASGAEMKDSPSTEISRRLPPVVPMRAERKLCSRPSFSIVGNVGVVGGDEDGGGGLGEETEERMSEKRGILLDGGADAFGNAACARATAMPPSEMSRAERMSLRQASWRANCAGRLRRRDRARAECPRGCRERLWQIQKNRRQ